MAVERYQQYLAIRPGDAEARYTLGLAFKELQHTELAIEQFEKSITHVADNAEVHRELGDAYAKLHRLEEAINPYQTAIALQADDVVTTINLGHVYHGLRRYTRSVPLYRQAMALQPRRRLLEGVEFRRRRLAVAQLATPVEFGSKVVGPRVAKPNPCTRERAQARFTNRARYTRVVPGQSDIDEGSQLEPAPTGKSQLQRNADF